MATHSSTLAWRTPWTEKSEGGLQSIESLRLSMHAHDVYLRQKSQLR